MRDSAVDRSPVHRTANIKLIGEIAEGAYACPSKHVSKFCHSKHGFCIRHLAGRGGRLVALRVHPLGTFRRRLLQAARIRGALKKNFHAASHERSVPFQLTVPARGPTEVAFRT